METNTKAATNFDQENVAVCGFEVLIGFGGTLVSVIVNVSPADDEQTVRVPKTGEQVKSAGTKAERATKLRNSAYKGKRGTDLSDPQQCVQKGSTDLSDLSLDRWLDDAAIQQGANRVSRQVTVVVVVTGIDVSSTVSNCVPKLAVQCFIEMHVVPEVIVVDQGRELSQTCEVWCVTGPERDSDELRCHPGRDCVWASMWRVGTVSEWRRLRSTPCSGSGGPSWLASFVQTAAIIPFVQRHLQA